MTFAEGFGFDNSYARLPERFYARLPPTPVAAPRLVKLNEGLARLLGLDPGALASPEGVEMLAGNRLPDGAEPIAMAYAGHQFGAFVPQLGDGRAILLGEVVGRDGVRRDIQLKGSGRTPFSRMGDGRAVLGPVLREYIVSEAMAALGLPTTRALAAVLTGERVRRETLEPGAVLTRVARSHVRVGTFEFFAVRGDREALGLLLDHVVERLYPELLEAPNRALAFLDAVIGGQARLVAQWLGVGFIHGVMNTDNMSVAGETIDYGPCAFMDTYHPATVYSSIDQFGRYAYGNQPLIAHWNLARLAQSLLPLIDADREKAVAAAQAAIDIFPDRFEAEWTGVLRAKLGLGTRREGDRELAEDFLKRMQDNGADFTLTFRALAAAAAGPEGDAAVRALFVDGAAFDAWAEGWRARLAEEAMAPAERAAAMRQVNPAFIPRNHRVEQALAAGGEGDFAPFETLLRVLARPYDDQPDFSDYVNPPRPEEVVQATFCGT
ncbi:MAG TPA: YdiU family protein [Paracoccaceae bacterium]|nr:YdiU family protein [Paracoccaceae bacterium]